MAKKEKIVEEVKPIPSGLKKVLVANLEELGKIEAEGKLVGYNPDTKEALVKV